MTYGPWQMAMPAQAALAELEHAMNLGQGSVGVEWVVDVVPPGESLWTLGTVYSFNDVTGMLRVAVPDREESRWEGDVPLHPDHIHLVECCDDLTTPFYLAMLRSSIVPVEWQVNWMVEEETPQGFATIVHQGNATWCVPAPLARPPASLSASRWCHFYLSPPG